MHRFPAIDSGWFVYSLAPTLREAQRAYVRERYRPRALWSFVIRWEPA